MPCIAEPQKMSKTLVEPLWNSNNCITHDTSSIHSNQINTNDKILIFTVYNVYENQNYFYNKIAPKVWILIKPNENITELYENLNYPCRTITGPLWTHHRTSHMLLIGIGRNSHKAHKKSPKLL